MALQLLFLQKFVRKNTIAALTKDFCFRNFWKLSKSFGNLRASLGCLDIKHLEDSPLIQLPLPNIEKATVQIR